MLRHRRRQGSGQDLRRLHRPLQQATDDAGDGLSSQVISQRSASLFASEAR
ncbi:MAG: hypothetical protein R2873_11035 [Caldilineaceae bacterium]